MTSEYGKDSKNHGCMLTKIMQSLPEKPHHKNPATTSIKKTPWKHPGVSLNSTHQDTGELLSLRLLGQILESCEAEVGGW